MTLFATIAMFSKVKDVTPYSYVLLQSHKNILSPNDLLVLTCYFLTICNLILSILEPHVCFIPATMQNHISSKPIPLFSIGAHITKFYPICRFGIPYVLYPLTTRNHIYSIIFPYNQMLSFISFRNPICVLPV